MEEKQDVSACRAQGREHKDKKYRETNFIITGKSDYGNNESSLNLTIDFLKEKLYWRGQICQARRVGKICEERPRPIKVIMVSVQDKHYLLSKKKLLKGSHYFLDEDLTSKQQEVRREEVEKIRATRNEGKRAWLYNGKVVIAMFRPHGKAGQQFGSKEKPINSIIGRKTMRSRWMKRGEGSNLSLVYQAV